MATILLSVFILAGLAIRMRRNWKAEETRRKDAELRYASACAELERQALQFRSHYSDANLHLH